MRRLFGFIGGKGTPGDVVQELASQLLGTGVTGELWEKLVNLENLEEELEEQPRREALVSCLSRCPENCYALVVLCVESMETQLAKKDFDATAETILANAIVILSYLLAALPPATARGSAEKAAEASNVAFVDKLWQVESGQRPLGERIADAIMRALFRDGFAVEGPEDKDAPQAEKGIVPALIWQEGVGPEGSSQPKNDLQENRMVALQLLVTFLSGGAPTAPVLQDTTEEDAESIDTRLSRLVILDARPLAYLTNPCRTVPFRGELLFSLLSVALGYDPHGFGVPYGGYFAGAKQEAFAHVCLQAVGLLLQDVRDATNSQGDLSISSSLIIKRPQELLATRSKSIGSIPEDAEGSPVQHAFRELLANISSTREVEFMVDGVVTLLGTVSKEKGSYLPSSMRLPPFLPELLIVVFHLTACPKFVAGACAEDIIGLIEGVLLAASQAPEHVCETTLSLIEAAILLNLTSYREVCAELEEDYEGNAPESVPDFEGSVADLVAMAALTQASEFLNKSKASTVQDSIVQMSFATVANVSAFADGLCMEVSSRLFSLFERCAKAVQLKRNRQGIANHLPLLLEVFDNALQYRYSSNTNLAYGLMTRQAIFRDLVSFVPQVQTADVAQEGDNALELNRQWQEAVEVHLFPIAGLLEATVPILEAEVEKHEISNSDEAKEPFSTARTSTLSTLLEVSLSCSGVTKTEKPIPARGSQYTGVGLAVDQVEELLQNRAFLRSHLREELEQQSRQQLRGCVERFILREGEQDSPEELPPCEQAASMASLLQMRQHRHLTDVMRRQFQDYLLALRLCSLAALWLLPSGVLPVSEDLPPPVKLESLDGTAGRCQGEAENDADAAEGRFLYRTLCQQLLDRTLRILSDLQRDELLALKRANAAEQRLTLQQLCQLEPDQIEKAQQLDLKEFEAQVTLRLLSDAERQINDEHKKQTCRVSQDVELQLVQYKREVQEAEQVIVQERHKWLTNRIVVLQSNGSGTVNPNDRPLLSRLRAELQACEVKMEAYKRDLAMVPAPEPCNEPRPRRHSDELASAQAPLAPLALWQRPHRGLRLCESPDFGRPREPRDHRDYREHRDWRPPLSQSTRMKGDIFGGYKEMSIPTQAEPLGSPPRQVKMSPGKRPKLPPVPLSAR